jgi:hypothetical protein
MFTMEEFMNWAKPGDILLTANPAGLGKLINFGQGIEDAGGRGSQYGHVAIVAHSKADRLVWKVDGGIYESVMTIGRNHIRKYHQKRCCLMRHTAMDAAKYFEGLKEVEDNLGQPYPAHRIVLHGFDMINSWIKRAVFRRKAPLRFRYMKLMPLDWPVCSELGAQFIHAAGLRGGWEEQKKGWRGVNPDDFYDAAVIRPSLWQMITEGVFISA